MQCHEFTTKHGRHRVTTRTAKISDCERYRWWLCRDWTPPEQPVHSWCEGRVAWLMLNPSTADHRLDDPTIVRCMKFSASWGYTGMLVVNLFPFRSSSPKACKEWHWPHGPRVQGPETVEVSRALQENLRWIESIARVCDLHVVACGSNVINETWFDQCLRTFGTELDDHGYGINRPLFCLGRSGRMCRPLHPMARGKLRVPDDREPIPFARG